MANKSPIGKNCKHKLPLVTNITTPIKAIKEPIIYTMPNFCFFRILSIAVDMMGTVALISPTFTADVAEPYIQSENRPNRHIYLLKRF